MLFQTAEFLLFLIAVFVLHWCGPVRMRVPVLVAASLFFYGWWDWRFLGLILGSAVIDFAAGLALRRLETAASRRAVLILSLSVNLGALCLFKYWGFFTRELSSLLSGIGIETSWVLTDLILPLGISFYTLQTMCYTIDVYRRRIEPARQFLPYLAYVTFFPQLVAGPIERADALLPQFTSPRVFDMEAAKDGARQLLLGLFKKAVIADNCGVIADEAFGSPGALSGVGAAVGVGAFAFQIYADFSGYSDMAIGMARFFGIELRDNFRSPYLAVGIVDFWRRWHISLSSWFRDYLYVPLGGGKGGTARRLRNVLIVFAVSGLWHGANWTFIAWGLFHAALYVPTLMVTGRGSNSDIGHGGVRRLCGSEMLFAALTFGLVCLGWVLFRSPDMPSALTYYSAFTSSVGSVPGFGRWLPAVIGLLMLAEWWQTRRRHALDIAHVRAVWRRVVYLVVLMLVIMFGRFGDAPFIYFQF